MILDRQPDDPEVAYAIETTQLCRTLNVLPYEGGLFNQPWIVVELMKMVISAQHERERRDSQRGT